MPHHHHNSRPHLTPDDSQPEASATTNNVFAKFGFEEMDPEMMDMFLGMVVTQVDTDIVSAGVELVKKSKVFDRVLEIVEKKSGGDVALEKRTMFVLAMLTGSCCMLEAVDLGLVPDSGDDEDDDEEGV